MKMAVYYKKKRKIASFFKKLEHRNTEARRILLSFLKIDY